MRITHCAQEQDAQKAAKLRNLQKMYDPNGIFGADVPVPEVPATVKGCKAAGNAALKRAEQLKEAEGATEAVERNSKLNNADLNYTRALDADPDGRHPERAAILANRALVRLRMGWRMGVSGEARFRQCIEDCSAALALQPVYPKAMFRRAKARLALARWLMPCSLACPCPCRLPLPFPLGSAATAVHSSPVAKEGSPEQTRQLRAALLELGRIVDDDPSNKEVGGVGWKRGGWEKRRAG